MSFPKRKKCCNTNYSRERGATGKEIQDTVVSKEFYNAKFHIRLFHYPILETETISEIMFLSSCSDSR